MKKTIFIALLFCFKIATAQKSDYNAVIKTSANKIEQQVIGWRHDIHQNPELANRETRTAAIIAKHLQSLGIEVKTGVAVTGMMHACGHDAHVAILMSVAEILAGMKKELRERPQNFSTTSHA